MKFITAIVALLAANANAFAPVTPRATTISTTGLFESTASDAAVPATPAPPAVAPPASADVGGALVAINDETIEFTAGIAGGVAGLVIGGPVVGLLAATASNYVSRTKDESGEIGTIINAVSTKSIEVFNYLAKIDAKYEVLSSAQSNLEAALVDLKSSNSSPETQKTIAKVEEALEKTTNKLTELNDEYDLLDAGVLALGVVGDVVEKTIKTVSNLNEEYQLTDKAIEALQNAVNNAKKN